MTQTPKAVNCPRTAPLEGVPSGTRGDLRGANRPLIITFPAACMKYKEQTKQKHVPKARLAFRKHDDVAFVRVLR